MAADEATDPASEQPVSPPIPGDAADPGAHPEQPAVGEPGPAGDDPSPEPAQKRLLGPSDADAPRVWMVNLLTGMDGRRGRLFLEPSKLVFRPDSTDGETSIPLAFIKRARRVVGSPVLEIRVDRSKEMPPVFGFYFVAPPSLAPPEGARFKRERARRRSAAATLMSANPGKKEEIRAWVAAIQTAKSASSGKG
jgi:hypothetical protein